MSATSENPPMITSLSHVSWNELVSSNESASAAFYGSLFGWKTTPFETGSLPCTLFKIDGEDKGLASMIKASRPDAPSMWIPYIVVADIDASAAKASALGGKVILPPTAIKDVGTICVVSDPIGAVFGLHQPSAV